MSRNMLIWRNKLSNAKMGVIPAFTWTNEAWYICINETNIFLKLYTTCLFKKTGPLFYQKKSLCIYQRGHLSPPTGPRYMFAEVFIRLYQDSFYNCKVRIKWKLKSSFEIFPIKFLFLVSSFQKYKGLVYFLKADWYYISLKA